MDKNYILSVDQSTSGTKALLVDKQGRIAAKCSKEHAQLYPQPGWVEHDAMEIYGNVQETIRRVLELAGVSPQQLAALTVTNQRETAVIWDRETGLPVHHAIVWQCRRTAGLCAELKEGGFEGLVRDKTGLVLDPYFSAGKIRWILEHLDPAYRKEAEASGRLLAGTIDSWLLWKLTGGEVHATDYTNASRTSLFNIHTLQWDAELISLFGVGGVKLPEVKSSNAVYGVTRDAGLFPDEVPISGVIGDSQGALFGQMCYLPGMAKATYGTGTSVMMNIGSSPVSSRNGLVTAIAWGIDGTVHYALEGIIHSSGDSMKWVRDQMGLFTDYAEAEQQAASLQDNEGVYFVPALVGLGAPYWSPDARAAVTGMSRRSDRRHIIRAALESIAYQVRDMVDLLQAESGIRLQELRVDGGGAQNQFLMQYQADMLQASVVRPAVSELSAIGSTYLGGIGVGFWKDTEEIRSLASDETTFQPSMHPENRDLLCQGWKKAVLSVIS
ncbi:glycerol kinase GlpK [Paenibacillus sp. y28]|uniref:glycerol kinase GlpK n=1 Tax=Paenibacillus sp. y28 TaxID=3129110 RepID=UPI003017375E